MLKVLIVDDSLIVRNTLKQKFEDLGYEVVGLASSGKEAILLNSRLKPDLITMDITMPLMNGIEATQHILFEFPEVKILMITSHGEEDLVMDAIASGADGYLLKPITHGNILTALNKLYEKENEKEEEEV